MAYFKSGTGWPEQMGKLIGDTLASTIVVFVVVLVIANISR